MDNKVVSLICLLCLATTAVVGQGVRLNSYGGYVFNDRFETINSNNSFITGRINGGFQWGVGMEFLPFEDYGIELLYVRQDTEAPVSYFENTVVNREWDLGINYFMLGGLRYLNTGGALVPYAGAMVGAVHYNNKTPSVGEPEDVTRFAWGARAGVNIWVSERVGIKIQSQVLSAVQSVGGGFYVGPGGGGAGVNTYSTVFQFNLGGGVTIRIAG